MRFHNFQIRGRLQPASVLFFSSFQEAFTARNDTQVFFCRSLALAFIQVCTEIPARNSHQAKTMNKYRLIPRKRSSTDSTPWYTILRRRPSYEMFCKNWNLSMDCGFWRNTWGPFMKVFIKQTSLVCFKSIVLRRQMLECEIIWNLRSNVSGEGSI